MGGGPPASGPGAVLVSLRRTVLARRVLVPGLVLLASLAEIDGVARCSDVKRGAVLAEFHQASVRAFFELRTEWICGARVGDVQHRPVLLARVAEVDGVAGRGDVEADAILAELEPTGVPPYEFPAERVGGACVGDVQRRAIPPADDHHLLTVKRRLPDLRLKRAVISGQLGGDAIQGEVLES